MLSQPVISYVAKVVDLSTITGYEEAAFGMGDYVVVINADKVVLTGKKEEDKQYMFYTGYYGNEYRRTAADFRKRKPEFLIEEAVKGMLPKKSALARQMLKKLRVFAGSEHAHGAQNPTAINI